MGQDKLAECLLGHGANALVHNHFGQTAQEIAQRYGHHSIVQMPEDAAVNISIDEYPQSSHMLGAAIEEYGGGCQVLSSE